MSQNLATLSDDLRVRVVNSAVAGNNDGTTLSGLSVAGVPEGALAYVRGNNAWYSYKPRSTAAIDPSDYRNVVPSSGEGNWVRLEQRARGTLASGTLVITGHFDLSGAGDFAVTSVGTPTGTQGFRYAVRTSATVATVTSSQAGDNSAVLVTYVEASSA